MNPEEESRLIAVLREQFVLVPKNRMYHFIGGAIGFVVVAFGVNLGTLVAYMRTDPAEDERREIRRIHQEVKGYYDDLGTNIFITRDREKEFLTERDAKEFVTKQDLAGQGFITAMQAEAQFLASNGEFLIEPVFTGSTLKKTLALHVHNDQYENGVGVNVSTDIHQTWRLVTPK